MHGNVWEWVQDWYGSYTSGTAVDPAGPFSGSNRMNRGGSWRDATRYGRSAHRHIDAPGFRYDFLGFRLLRMAQ
jgi:formylglycine-generating enzyme required for sulfatase activity